MTQEKKQFSIKLEGKYYWIVFDNETHICCTIEKDKADFLVRSANNFHLILQSLKEAKEMVQTWGAYADKYYQKKWDLKGNIEKLQQAIKAAEEGAEEGNE